MNELLQKEFLDKFIKLKADKFYKHLLVISITKIINAKYQISPEIELLNFSNRFLELYRLDDSNKEYLQLSNIFRKAANKIYRLMFARQLVKHNKKFLNVIK